MRTRRLGRVGGPDFAIAGDETMTDDPPTRGVDPIMPL